jgi:hypothetical protein
MFYVTMLSPYAPCSAFYKQLKMTILDNYHDILTTMISKDGSLWELREFAEASP